MKRRRGRAMVPPEYGHSGRRLGMSERMLEGGCACGAVRYRGEGAPITVNKCYCALCQTGSASMVNAFHESGRISLSGKLTDYVAERERRPAISDVYKEAVA